MTDTPKPTLLYVHYVQDGREKTRYFDFSHHTARDAFVRFASWAIKTETTFVANRYEYHPGIDAIPVFKAA